MTKKNNDHIINTKPFVYAVDDDPMALMFVTALLEDMQQTYETSDSAQHALDYIKSNADKIDIILLDRKMPDMSGIEIVKTLKNLPGTKHIPIVMMTGADRPEQIREGIEAGVFYYLIKPLKKDVLESVVQAALNEATQKKVLRNEMSRHRLSFGLFQNANLQVQTLNEAESLAGFLAQCFPEPDRVLLGLAELLINAVEHGNCGITYDEKTILVKEKRWRAEVEKRLAIASNQDKYVHILLERSPHETAVTITDRGNGFNWQDYMDIDPSRALDNHGRGIAQANLLSFDKIEYNDRGNSVRAIVTDSHSELEW